MHWSFCSSSQRLHLHSPSASSSHIHRAARTSPLSRAPTCPIALKVFSLSVACTSPVRGWLVPDFANGRPFLVEICPPNLMVRREAEYTHSICPALTLRTDEADRCDASHCSGCAVTSPRAFSHDFVAVQFFAVDAGAVQERGSGDKTASDGVTGRSVEQPRRNGFVSNEQLSCTSSTTCHILFRSRHRSQDWFLTAAVWRVCCMWRGTVCVGCRGCCADTEVRM